MPQNSFAYNQLKPLNTLLSESNAIYKEGKITAWAKVNNSEYLNSDENINSFFIRDISENLCDKTLMVRENETGLTIMSDITSTDKFAASIYQDIRDKNYYIILSFTNSNSLIKLQEWQNKFEQYLKDNNFKSEISFQLTGTLNKKLSNQERKELVDRLFKKLNAKKIEGIDNNDIISISGYTSIIKNYILSNKNKINLNIALTYNELEKRTYVLIGSPLLDGEY